MNVCVQCGGSFRPGEPRVDGICSGCWAKKLSIDPQPRQPLKTAPSLDYTAGFRAGIEAAAALIEGVGQSTPAHRGGKTVSSAAQYFAATIRNLKPEDGT